MESLYKATYSDFKYDNSCICEKCKDANNSEIKDDIDKCIPIDQKLPNFIQGGTGQPIYINIIGDYSEYIRIGTIINNEIVKIGDVILIYDDTTKVYIVGGITITDEFISKLDKNKMGNIYSNIYRISKNVIKSINDKEIGVLESFTVDYDKLLLLDIVSSKRKVRECAGKVSSQRKQMKEANIKQHDICIEKESKINLDKKSINKYIQLYINVKVGIRTEKYPIGEVIYAYNTIGGDYFIRTLSVHEELDIIQNAPLDFNLIYAKIRGFCTGKYSEDLTELEIPRSFLYNE